MGLKGDTVDDINPASPSIHYTTRVFRVLVHEVMHALDARLCRHLGGAQPAAAGRHLPGPPAPVFSGSGVDRRLSS